ncbi:SDR family NAD(P)-dependent oxidoreductase [Shimia ponticola]|uniref:SDR family NAD(P)-dependent oxidoreductase n=1 Tax=Shimia ponticola TaxID=2582893 RepID=UPI0011BFA0FA|nr:SDR family NAD(P)-dependent oxidoreductase [Shimia ponticola]
MAKSILITGCSTGIGYDCAHYLKSKGWRVFASCRKQEDCDRLISEGFESPRIDYEEEASVEAGLAEVLDATGGTLDALFNNGAYAIPGAVEDLPRAALRQIFEANLFGYHDLTRRVIPVMRTQGHGRILNCSSVLGFAALKWRGAYNTTKFAMEGLSDTMRLELRDSGIHVVLIQPGPITTKIRQNSIPHFEKWIDWENSALSGLYRASLHKRLYADDQPPDKFELPPRTVSVKVHEALTVARPKSRYKITFPTYLMAVLRRILPRRLFDNILARA